MNIIARHLNGKPVKDFELSVKTATSKLEVAAGNALAYATNPCTNTKTAFVADEDYWQRFISDFVGDIELQEAVMQAMQEGSAQPLQPHLAYLKRLAQSGNALPDNTAQPKKKKKVDAFCSSSEVACGEHLLH